MESRKPVQEEQQAAWQRKLDEEREKLVVQKVTLPNGATFTRLKPVTATT
jgi:hypothetical protein